MTTATAVYCISMILALMREQRFREAIGILCLLILVVGSVGALIAA